MPIRVNEISIMSVDVLIWIERYQFYSKQTIQEKKFKCNNFLEFLIASQGIDMDINKPIHETLLGIFSCTGRIIN